MKSTIFNNLLAWYFKKRIQQIQLSLENPLEYQDNIFKYLIKNGQKTSYGKQFSFDNIKTQDQFKNNVPINDYDSLKPYIQKHVLGEQKVLWPTEISWFAKSSGTTSDKSKFIPVSFEALEECQFRGGRDLLTFYCHSNQSTHIFSGKGLLIGGSHEINQCAENSYYGDLSAVIMNNLPFWVNLLSTPKPEIALMPNWEIKLEKMAQATVNEDVTSISGVPTWTLVLFKRLLEITGKQHISEIWPNLELYMHGGVNFEPYRKHFESFIPSPKMNYLETYNASEGFFGIQEYPNDKGMLLMMDYGIFYEFLPIEHLNDNNPITIGLADIEPDKNYALIITTNSGLWRYMIGDTIKFINKNPYKFLITGRTKLFINAFGEELMIENAEHAISKTCNELNVQIRDFTVAPVYLDGQNAGCHEWLIEFETPPENLELFTITLDNYLKESNSDYEAKRNGNLALKLPKILLCKTGTFYEWMKMKNKLGGQNKIPRLSNNRLIINEIKTRILQVHESY